MSKDSKLNPSDYLSLAWEAFQNFFIPLGWLAAILQFKKDLGVGFFYVLLAALFLYIIFILLKNFRTQNHMKSRMARLESLSRLSRIPHNCRDNSFQYTKSARKYFLEGTDLLCETTEDGKNVSSENQDQIIRTITGDSPVEFDNLNFNASIKISERKEKAIIEYEPIIPGRLFRIIIKLPDGLVISPQNHFTLTYSFCWPGCCSLNSEYYVIFNAFQYANKIGCYEGEFHFSKQPITQRLYKFKASNDEAIQYTSPSFKMLNSKNWFYFKMEEAFPSDPFILEWKIR